MVASDFVAVQDLDHWFRATRETAELRAETKQMGYSLRRLCLELVAYLWSWLENQVMVALKAVPLGQTDGQRLLLRLGDGLSAILLVINKIDLAPMVGASLEVMDRDSRKMRGQRPFVFSNLKTGEGLETIVAFIEKQGLMK